jgi:hypothetical protein
VRRPAIIVLCAVVALAALWFVWRHRGDDASSGARADGQTTSDPAATRQAGSARAGDLPSTLVATAIPPAAKDDAPRFIAFGIATDALGRGVTADGRPVAPSSFLADKDGLLVLDQEKARLVRPDGSSIALPKKYADDLARADDGSFAILDRTHDKDVTMLDPSGRVRGRIPLAGTGLEDPRDVSRVVVSGNDVLVERNGGGPLLRIGGIDGAPAKERTEIQGIPTRDGKFLASAGITSEDEGRAWVTLADRQAVHRWTRELRFPAALSAVAFLDSDVGGTIWVVLLAGSTRADYINWAVCMDPATGTMRGSFTLTVEDPPWESFRDFAVHDGVGLVAAKRDSNGVTYATYRCP